MMARLNQNGSMIILSIFVIFILIVFMALAVNAGYLITHKIQMQNAVDSSAYSGAVIQARGLNLLSALNQSLEMVTASYQKGLTLWGAAVLADQGKPEGPLQKAWRFSFEKPLRTLCSPSYLKKISCAQSNIVSRFNPVFRDGSCRQVGVSFYGQSIALKEAEVIGEGNIAPILWEKVGIQSFSSWGMNFHQGNKMPGLSVEVKPQTVRHLTGAGRNAVSIGITCDVPAEWGLKGDFYNTQYILSSATTPVNEALFFNSSFGSGDKIYTIAMAKPDRPDMRSLELQSTDWSAALVPVNTGGGKDDPLQRFRRTTEGKALGFQQVPTQPLLH
jgi:hypothetical protein